MLVVDIGNSETTLGFFQHGELLHHWRLPTRHDTTHDELAATLSALWQSTTISIKTISTVWIASVVPYLNSVYSAIFQNKVHLIDNQHKFNFNIRIEQPHQIGADRLVNAHAAIQLYGKPLIIVDAGTATTFCIVNKQAEYLGGAIAPGVQIAAKSLMQKAARLSHIELQVAPKWIGGNTEAAMASGMVNAHAAMINGMLNQLKSELDEDHVRVIATGGMMHLLRPLLKTIDHFDPQLTLKGIYLAAKQNGGAL